MRWAWVAPLLAVAAVALANKNARIAWALLAHGRDYQPASLRVAP